LSSFQHILFASVSDVMLFKIYKQDVFYKKDGETLEQLAQRGSGGPIPRNIPGRAGGPIPRNIPGQVGQGSEQSGLVEDAPVHCRGVGLDDR